MLTDGNGKKKTIPTKEQWEGPFQRDTQQTPAEMRETGMPQNLNQDPVAFYGLDDGDSLNDEELGTPETPEGIEEEQL